MKNNRRIVLATFGSYGDLHPFVGIALKLKERGHHPVVATCEMYRAKIEKLGLEFFPVRPEIPDWKTHPEAMAKLMDLRKGTEYLVRNLLLPELRHTYDDLSNACEGADLLVSHPLVFAASIVAEKKSIKWISTMLQPMGFFSTFDPPALPQAPILSMMRYAGPTLWGLLFRAAKKSFESWNEPLHQLRMELGLPAKTKNLMFDANHSPTKVLALFSPKFATPQIDWPKQCVATGFPDFDDDGSNQELSETTRFFLEKGPAPIVFTLGTAAVRNPGSFYEESFQAAKLLRTRAIFLIGRETQNCLSKLPDTMHIAEYEPFSKLFPKALAIVHQGGIGTTAQVLKAGVPSLVVPHSHDQPDNAMRCEKLGVAKVISKAKYQAKSVARHLASLTTDANYQQRAKIVAADLIGDDGSLFAAMEIEKCL